jgi:hypothetical protein
MDELTQTWRARRTELDERWAEDYQAFRAFHLDKPTVDFVRVYEPSETLVYNRGQRVDLRQSLGYGSRRQGIASSLYECAALWLHEAGWALHASGVPSSSHISAFSLTSRPFCAGGS